MQSFQRRKSVLPPSKKLLCVVARGIFTKWKVPVYFSADEPMTIKLLFKIVSTLELNGFKIRGVSFDLGNI